MTVYAKSLHQRDDGWYYSDEAEQLHGPYPTCGMAHARLVHYATVLTLGLQQPYPAQSCSYRQIGNGKDAPLYVVIAIADEECLPLRIPAVVVQGEDGRVWSTPMDEFLATMEFVRGSVPALQIEDIGGAVVDFADAYGSACLMRESSHASHLNIGLTRNPVHQAEGVELPPHMHLSTEGVRNILPYLLHFCATGRLPDETLDVGWMREPLALDDSLELARLRALTQSPEIRNFLHGVVAEAAHQIERHGTNADAGKEPRDFIFLVGYLLGKADEAIKQDDEDRARHHLIAAGAVILNWWRRDFGDLLAPGLTRPPQD